MGNINTSNSYYQAVSNNYDKASDELALLSVNENNYYDKDVNNYNMEQLDNIMKKINNSNGVPTILDLIYPIGSIYFTADKIFDPNTIFGGTWEQLINDSGKKRCVLISNTDNGKTTTSLITTYEATEPKPHKHSIKEHFHNLLLHKLKHSHPLGEKAIVSLKILKSRLTNFVPRYYTLNGYPRGLIVLENRGTTDGEFFENGQPDAENKGTNDKLCSVQHAFTTDMIPYLNSNQYSQGRGQISVSNRLSINATHKHTLSGETEQAFTTLNNPITTEKNTSALETELSKSKVDESSNLENGYPPTLELYGWIRKA